MKIVEAGRALREGLRRLGRHWPALLVAYGVNLVSALALAIFPATRMLEWAQRPALEQAANGISARMVVDFLGAGITSTALGINADARDLQLAILWVLIVAVVLPFVVGLPAALLGGGLVLTYVESPATWSWKRFAWGCWHWFGAFTLLGLVQAIVTGLASVVAVILLAVLGVASWLGWVVAALLAIDLAATLALFEVAGVWMISNRSRNIANALGQAFRYLLKHAALLGSLYAAALGALALAHALYVWDVWPNLPLAIWPLVLVAEQIFILVRLAARLLRLSSVAVLMAPSAAPAAVSGLHHAASADA